MYWRNCIYMPNRARHNQKSYTYYKLFRLKWFMLSIYDRFVLHCRMIQHEIYLFIPDMRALSFNPVHLDWFSDRLTGKMPPNFDFIFFPSFFFFWLGNLSRNSSLHFHQFFFKENHLKWSMNWILFFKKIKPKTTKWQW